MAAPAVTITPTVVGRSAALDAFRGLAILLMIGDHVSLILGFDAYRYTLGRAAMPAFFLLAGHLAGRLSWRHVRIAAIGLALPLAVPWIDSPNVLVLWSVGCLLLWGLRRWGAPVQLVAILALAAAANGWGALPFGRSYVPLALWGLMAVGAGLPRTWFTWAGVLPAWVAAMGRHPIAWYVGHLLVLEGVMLWLSNA